MRDTDGGQVQDGAEMQRQPGLSRVIASRRVEEQHGGLGAQTSYDVLPQRTHAEGEQSRDVRTRGVTGHQLLPDDATAIQDERGGPSAVAGRARTCQSARETDPDPADQKAVRRSPQCRLRVGKLLLPRDQFAGLGRPGHRWVRNQSRASSATCSRVPGSVKRWVASATISRRLTQRNCLWASRLTEYVGVQLADDQESGCRHVGKPRAGQVDSSAREPRRARRRKRCRQTTPRRRRRYSRRSIRPGDRRCRRAARPTRGQLSVAQPATGCRRRSFDPAPHLGQQVEQQVARPARLRTWATYLLRGL